MKNQKVNGYVFITVTVLVTILVSTLTVAISGQNKNIKLIQNYEASTIIEEEEWDFKPINLYSPPKLNFQRKVKKYV